MSTAQNKQNKNSIHDDTINSNTLFLWIANILIYCFLHYYATGYLLTYIEYRDAQENSKYMNIKMNSFSNDEYENELNKFQFRFTICYSLLIVQAFCLGKLISHHLLPSITTSIFYGLSYLLLTIFYYLEENSLRKYLDYGNKTDEEIEDITLLSNNLTSASIFLKNVILYLTCFVAFYCICVCIKNYKTRYYFNENNIVFEYFQLLITYYILGFIIVCLPIIIMIYIACLFTNNSGNNECFQGNNQNSNSTAKTWSNFMNGYNMVSTTSSSGSVINNTDNNNNKQETLEV